MTEAEWQECTDSLLLVGHLLRQVGPVRATKRKLRHLACAIGRRLWNEAADQEIIEAIRVAELVADGIIKLPPLLSPNPVDRLAGQVIRWLTVDSGHSALMCIVNQHRLLAERENHSDIAKLEECSKQTQLLRDIFGNPFRTVIKDPSWLRWNESTVVKLAQAIYDDLAFDRLPILADALEDAGCDNSEILGHCRQPSPHVRGCWVVDILLGKE